MEGPSNDSNIEYKVSRMLEKFLEPQFKVKNEVYLNLFLTHLIGKPGDGDKQKLTNPQKSQFNQWLIRATQLWDTTSQPPPIPILIFALNLASTLSVDEKEFKKLNSSPNLIENLLAISHANFAQDSTLICGYLKLLNTLLEHSSGTQWIMASRCWGLVIHMGRGTTTPYVNQKAYQFIAKLLEKAIRFNRKFCGYVVQILINPLKNAAATLPDDQHQVQALFESLKPHLAFLIQVMEILVRSVQTIPLSLFVEYQAIELSKQLVAHSHIQDFSIELLKIQCIPLFSKLGEEASKKSNCIKEMAQNATVYFDIKTMFDLLESEMKRDHVQCVIKLAYYANGLYYDLAGKIPLCFRKGQPIEFQNQMVLFQIMPLMVFFAKVGNTRRHFQTDTFRLEFVLKIVRISAVRTFDIGLKWRNRLIENSIAYEDVMCALIHVGKVKKYLNKAQGAIFFQPLIYVLKDCLAIMENKNVGSEYFRPEFIQTLVKTIIDLVKTFDLTWKDSIEAISVLGIAIRFFDYSPWCEKTELCLLQLINLAMIKYMSPDMVLLMDGSEEDGESVMSRTGKLLFKYCQSSSCALREGTLECVLTLSKNANSKFQCHTKVLVETQLPRQVLEMALNDVESTVRANAFKCLQELIQITEIWQQFVVENKPVFATILDVIERGSESNVRKEVTRLMCNIHKFQKLPPNQVERVHTLMGNAVMCDSCWEVKCIALDFWFHEFKVNLNNQGMTDSDFPEFIFSKEKRKIILLNEIEIRQRLVETLNQLSQIGCLFVLKSAALDRYDLEVCQKARNALKEYQQIFKKYNVKPIDCEQFSNVNSPAGSESSSVPSSGYQSQNLECGETECMSLDMIMAELFSDLSPATHPSNAESPAAPENRYLSPAEFLEFLYGLCKQKCQKPEPTSEGAVSVFPTLLNDIFKEYNLAT